MKTVPVRDPDAELPANHERVRISAGASLVLPKEAADVLRQMQRQREEDERQRQREELLREREEEKVAAQKREAEKQESESTKFGPQPEPGWYRVMPKLEALLSDGSDTVSAVRSVDKDINERRSLIFKKLKELGPDRRIATVPSWRERVDVLEATLPNFREPIRLLRNALALADVTGVPARVPPMLLLGPPGVGKTHFSQQVAKLFAAPHASVHFDQPSAGGHLLGQDKHWSTSEPGLLFNHLCLGEYANPVVLLDEVDKSASSSGRWDINPLAQLHAVLEPVTAKCLKDSSLDVEFDGSLVTYIATANTAWGIGVPILSRMEVFSIEPPSRDESFGIAQAIVRVALRRFGLEERVKFERRAICLLAHLSPRLMTRAVEAALSAAVGAGRAKVGEDDLWAAARIGDDRARLH